MDVSYTRFMAKQSDNPGNRDTVGNENNTGAATGRRLTITRRDLLRVGLGVAGAGLLAGCGPGNTRIGQSRPAVIPSATATAMPSPTADTRPVGIVITGDIMMARSVGAHISAYDGLYPFAGTAEALKSYDLRIGNLECVVSTLGSPQPKTYTFEAPLRALDRLSAAGIQIVSVANNHSGDYGKAAFSDMLARLPMHGIMPVGGGANRVQAHSPVILRIHSTTIGILAYCEIGPTSFVATNTSPGHAWLEAAAMKQDIAALRPQVDFLIVFTHWGVEYVRQENAHQRYMARLAVDAGSDLVVGAHPHVIQPYEVYRGKPIVYSLGNFVFDEMPGITALGNVLTLSVQGSRLLGWKLRGTRIGADAAPVWTE
ncbi:MAG TPA: CapA family protein [Ktedonobacterales bacterium]|nr:CapA family protein [Ktedonobacterales bacterium]